MPRERKEGIVPYQFDLDEDLHRRGTELANQNGVSIAQFMRMAYEEFVNRPIEQSMKLLREHKSRQTETAAVSRMTPRRSK